MKKIKRRDRGRKFNILATIISSNQIKQQSHYPSPRIAREYSAISTIRSYQQQCYKVYNSDNCSFPPATVQMIFIIIITIIIIKGFQAYFSPPFPTSFVVGSSKACQVFFFSFSFSLSLFRLLSSSPLRTIRKEKGKMGGGAVRRRDAADTSCSLEHVG